MHGLVPSAASPTRLTGRPDSAPWRQSPPTPQKKTNPTTPLPITLRCSRGRSVSLSATVTLVWAGGCHPGATPLVFFGVVGVRGKARGGPLAVCAALLPWPGLEPSAMGQRRAPQRGRPGRARVLCWRPLGRNPPGAAGRPRNALIIHRRPWAEWMGPSPLPQFCRGSPLLKGLGWTLPFSTSLYAHTCKTAVLWAGIAFPKTLC